MSAYYRRMSYDGRKAITKHLSFGIRTELRRYDSLTDDLIPYKISKVETNISKDYTAFRLKIKYNNDENDKRHMVWDIVGGKMRCQFGVKEDCKVLEYQLETSDEDAANFHQLLNFYIGRKGTEVDVWEMTGGIPQIKLANIVQIKKLIHCRSLYTDCYQTKLLFPDSYTTVDQMVLIGEEQNSRGPVPAFATLALGKAMKVDIGGTSIHLDKVAKLIEMILEKCFTIGFLCVIDTGSVWFEEVYARLRAGDNGIWENKWYHSRKCATLERENDEVSVFSNFERERHTICIQISEKGDAQLTDSSPNRQLTEESLYAVIRYFPWKMRRLLYMEKERFCNMTVVAMTLESFHINADQIIVDGIEEGYDFLITHLGNQNIHINHLTIEDENVVPLSSWTFDNLTILSSKPFSSSFDQAVWKDRRIKSLTANCEETLKYLDDMKNRADIVLYIGETKLSKFKRFFNWITSFFYNRSQSTTLLV